MAWQLSADPERFDEAAEWFGKRTVITGAEARRLDEDSRQRSFWVGAGLQLTQVQRVFDAMKVAIDKGTPFREFQQQMARTLRDPVHAETVFRNAAQRAYNAGRYQQLREVEEWRPYWKFDAILDGRTSVICTQCGGTILLASDPWWHTHWPPLHHRCRSTVRSLRRSEAERLGITPRAPDLPETPGWGKAPENDPVWKPDPKKHEPALIRELERKEKKPRTKKPPARAEHKPSHWTKEYAHLGKAKACAAYGRAMAERALDRPAGEVFDELVRLKREGHPSAEFFNDYYGGMAKIAQFRSDEPLRNTAFAQRWIGLLALTEHTRSISGNTELELGGDTPKAVREAKTFYRLSLADKVKRPTGWRIALERGMRGYAAPGSKRIVLGDANETSTAVHELAHAIESTDKRALERSLAFLRARTKGEERASLRDLTGVDYTDNEVARPDKFLSAYMGKDYGSKLAATEITSMGYEYLATRIDRLTEADREMLYFLLGQLAGK